MRRRRLTWTAALLGAALAVGCAPRNVRAPAPVGDVLALKMSPGETRSARVRMLIEQEGVSAGRGATRRVVLELDGVDEETCLSEAEDGAMLVSARLVDVAGHAATGAEQKFVDQFALALDELKIQFKRSARGETANLSMLGARPPLEEQTARAVAQQVYAAGRGPLLPSGPVVVGATWRHETPLATTLELEGSSTYTYKYQRRDNQVAIISTEGRTQGKATVAPPRAMASSSSGELRFDLSTGRMVSMAIDSTTIVEERNPEGTQVVGTVRQRVRVNWDAR